MPEPTQPQPVIVSADQATAATNQVAPLPVSSPQQPTAAVQPQVSNPEVITTPEDLHKQMLGNIQAQLLNNGDTSPVDPVSVDSSEAFVAGSGQQGDSIQDFIDRAVYARPGFEPSASFKHEKMNKDSKRARLLEKLKKLVGR